MKSDEPAPHRIGKKNEEGPIYGKRAVRGAERRIRLPALCARLAAGGPDAGPLSRRPCRGGDGCRHARRRSAERNAELSLPGAQADPCCMGTAALESLEVLQGFIREELADRRTYLFLARRAPTAEVRQVFRAIASDEGRHARRLLAAVYLITGERYCPAICYPPLRCDGYCAALRERYHEEVCGGFNYRRASQETLDPCLQQLLLAFSQDEYRHANAMLCLLSGVM